MFEEVAQVNEGVISHKKAQGSQNTPLEEKLISAFVADVFYSCGEALFGRVKRTHLRMDDQI